MKRNTPGKGPSLVQVFLLVLAVSFVFAFFTLDTLASATPGGVAGVAQPPSALIVARVSESARTGMAPIRTAEVGNVSQRAWNEGNLAATRVMEGGRKVLPEHFRANVVQGVTRSQAAIRNAWADLKYWALR